MRADLLRKPLMLALAILLQGQGAGADAAEAAAVRPAFATPFNAAQDQLKAGHGPEALARLREAEALGNLSPYEQYLLQRVRASAEYANGDLSSAATDFAAVLASDQLPAADRVPVLLVQAQILYTDRQYASAAAAIQRYLDAGGQDARMSSLLPQALYMSKDYAAAAKLFKTGVDAQSAAGQKPDDKTLRLLASAQAQAGDDTGYVATLEHLAVAYPRPEYWKDLIARAVHVDNFPERLYLDVYRLKIAALGDIADSDRLTYATLAQRAGYPAEAVRVLDDGLARKALPDADLPKASLLREQAARSAARDQAQSAADESAARSAPDGNALVSLGLLSTIDGDAVRGIALTEEGMARGGLKFADDARLHLGLAQWRAGRPADALSTFQSVGGQPGLMALAHVWILLTQSRLQQPAQTSTTAAPVAK